MNNSNPPPSTRRRTFFWPLTPEQSLAMVGVVIATLVTLRVMGRIGWGGDGWPQFWVGDIWSEQCSQQLFDPYVFSHFSHGFFFYALVMWWWPPVWRKFFGGRAEASTGTIEAVDGVDLVDPIDLVDVNEVNKVNNVTHNSTTWRDRLAAPSFAAALMVAIVLECAWEILENSPIIINRYRATTIAVGYVGDSVLNSFMDIVACTAGVFVTRWLGPWRILALFVALELITLFTVRDNLTLNVIMLTFPIDAIKEWQEALAPASVK